MEYQWGAGCTERCKSGSERGLQKPVFQRHKALLSYSTIIGASSFSSWEDGTGNNRQMLESAQRSVSDESGFRGAAADVHRAAHGLPTALFHAGMATPIPLANGGTGACIR